jgi:hypothetical protein
MTTTRTRALALAIALGTMVSGLAHGQSTRASVARLQSASHADRRAAFDSLLSSANAGRTSRSYRDTMANLAALAARQPEVGRGLIGLLEYENAHPTEQESEDPYTGDLIAAVALLKDPSALNALMGAINTGHMATHGLAVLGDTAVPPLLRATAGPASLTRLSGLGALSDMVTMFPQPALSQDNRGRIRTVLVNALHDPDRFVRETALEGLPAFHDPEVRAAITDVAQRDTFAVHDRGVVRYPVREAAVAALRKP